jgi:hypothetical protein
MTSADRLRFHLIVDHAGREFFLNGGDNGIRLHYEMQLAARSQNKKLRETDIWAESVEAALAEVRGYLPDYRFMGELVTQSAFLENPNNPIFEPMTRDVLAAASVMGLKVQMLKASSDREIDTAFASLAQARTGALLVGGDPLFNNRIEQVTALAARHGIPSMYSFREYVVAGGLISYGTSLIENYRQVGLYAGRILKGEKPADLPVQQITKIELIINLKTAKTLGLEVPANLLALADEVIE